MFDIILKLNKLISNSDNDNNINNINNNKKIIIQRKNMKESKIIVQALFQFLLYIDLFDVCVQLYFDFLVLM